MSSTPLRVAIGGVAAASALLRRGIEVRLYEQAPTLTEVGGGGGLSGTLIVLVVAQPHGVLV